METEETSIGKDFAELSKKLADNFHEGSKKAITDRLQNLKIGILNAQQDMVNHPPHYNHGKFETIDVIRDIVSGYGNPWHAYLIGQVIKYISRAPFKGSYFQDLSKAHWYLTTLLNDIDDDVNKLINDNNDDVE
jgi:hypothetical protein